MNMIRAMGAAFGVDPTRFEAIVVAYEAGECRLCENTGKVGATPCPLCSDRLELIERRHREAGCGDADKGWLIEEVKKLRDALAGCDIRAQLDEALNSGDGTYRP